MGVVRLVKALNLKVILIRQLLKLLNILRSMFACAGIVTCKVQRREIGLSPKFATLSGIVSLHLISLREYQLTEFMLRALCR